MDDTSPGLRVVTCRADDSDSEFCATHEDGMFDFGEQECSPHRPDGAQMNPSDQAPNPEIGG